MVKNKNKKRRNKHSLICYFYSCFHVNGGSRLVIWLCFFILFHSSSSCVVRCTILFTISSGDELLFDTFSAFRRCEVDSVLLFAFCFMLVYSFFVFNSFIISFSTRFSFCNRPWMEGYSIVSSFWICYGWISTPTHYVYTLALVCFLEVKVVVIFLTHTHQCFRFIFLVKLTTYFIRSTI